MRNHHYTARRRRLASLVLLAGFASSPSVATPASTSTVTGTLYDGRINGRNLSFRVRWSNGRTSAYRGDIRTGGYVEGSDFDLAAPDARQFRVLKQRVPC